MNPESDEVAAVQRPAAAGEAMRWIPVSERLPANGDEVLVWIASPTWASKPYAGVDVWTEHREDPIGLGGGTIVTGHGWSDNEFDDISHWMPLPPAPSASAQPAARPDDQSRADARDAKRWREFDEVASDPEFHLSLDAGGWKLLKSMLDSEPVSDAVATLIDRASHER